MKKLLSSPGTRELLLFCLPAVLIGLALRVILTVQLPHALYLPDSDDYLTTVLNYIKEGELTIHAKKTFLTPFLFAVPFILHIPALPAIAAFQHVLGLGIILMAGVLCRLWFRLWKWFVIPVTLAVAVNPSLLWYEHVIMGETVFAFCVLLMLVAASVFVRRRDWPAFAALLGGVFLAAAARPEGKLFLAFTLLLILATLWARWRQLGIALGIFVVFALVTLRLTGTSQPGLLLLTSVVHWTPERFFTAPGLSEYLRPVGADVNQRWEERRDFATARHRKDVADAVKAYLQSQGRKAGTSEVNKLCKRAGIEIFFRNLHRAPLYVFRKYRQNAQTLPGGTFDEHYLIEKHKDAYADDEEASVILSRGLTGRQRTLEEIHQFIDAHFDPAKLGWFRAWLEAWENVTMRWATPERQVRGDLMDRGLPYLQLLAMAGLVAAALRFDRYERLHFAWLCGLLAFGFVLILTAPPKSRFTFVFEPFWTLYPFFIIDTVILWVTRGRRAGKS